jgi:hypothetical protein
MKLKSILLFLSLLFSVSSFSQQASLTIVNNSQRSMSVKVMRGSSGKGQLHEKVTIYANSSETIYFSQSGNYFTKTKATINGRDPICRKGKPFKVTSDETGYSVLTLTFTIKESKVPQVMGGVQISQKEFEQD